MSRQKNAKPAGAKLRRREILKGGTVLLSELSPDMDWEDEFNEWYDNHQIPIRMEVPGFISAHRYRDPERPNAYLAIYEITGTEVIS